jgi:hypothetical protein
LKGLVEYDEIHAAPESVSAVAMEAPSVGEEPSTAVLEGGLAR